MKELIAISYKENFIYSAPFLRESVEFEGMDYYPDLYSKTTDFSTGVQFPLKVVRFSDEMDSASIAIGKLYAKIDGRVETYPTTRHDYSTSLQGIRNDALFEGELLLPQYSFYLIFSIIENSVYWGPSNYSYLYLCQYSTGHKRYVFSTDELVIDDEIYLSTRPEDLGRKKYKIIEYLGRYVPIAPLLIDVDKATADSARFRINSVNLDVNTGTQWIQLASYQYVVLIDGVEYDPGSHDYYVDSCYPDDGVISKAFGGIDVNTDIASSNTYRAYMSPLNLPIAEFTVIFDAIEPDVPNPNPYNPGGVSRPGGGGGSFDGGPTDDPTTLIPNGTTEANASLSRIYTRYVLGSSELSIVGNRLWTTDIIHDIVNAIAELFASPFESLISLLSFPFDISSMQGYSAARQLMMWGNVQFISDGLFDVPQTAAVSFDWGEISIESFYDGFLDYAPYTKMELYLPWGTGVVSIDPNECTPGKIRIRSNIELDKGTAVHIVTSEFTRDGRTVKEVLGTYGTVVGKQIPITALDYAGKAHAVASVAVTAGAIALAGGVGAAATSSAGASTTALSTSVSPTQLAPIAATDMYPLVYTPKSEEFEITPEAIKLATEGINAAMTPGHVARNGSFMTGSAGLLPTTPFLIISRPEQSVPENYGHYYGYPSNIYSKLSDLSGFTQVGSIHLENIVCTEKERGELMTLLQGGVLL